MFELKFRTEMATFEPINNMDMSEKIYQDLLKLGSISRHTNNKRFTSANTTSTKSSYHASQCSSAISKTSRGSIQGSLTDFDIVKSKSWSGSKGRGNQFPLNSSFHKLRQSKQHSETFSLHNQLTDKDLITNNSASSLHGKGHSKPANNYCPDNSSQVIRLQQEWAALDHCRAVKRASEMVQHRLDPRYCLSGSNVPLFERYHIDEAELENLRKISAAGHRQLADSRRHDFVVTGVGESGAAVPSVHCKLRCPCNTPAQLSYNQSDIIGSETPGLGSCQKELTGCRVRHIDVFLHYKNERECSKLLAGNVNTDVASLYNEAVGPARLGPVKTNSLWSSVSIKKGKATSMPVKLNTICLQKTGENSFSLCNELDLIKENQKKCVIASKNNITLLLQGQPSTDAQMTHSNPSQSDLPLLTGLCKSNFHQNVLVPNALNSAWKSAQTCVWVNQRGFVSSLADDLNEQLGHCLHLSESYGSDPLSYRRVDACTNGNTNQSAADDSENADGNCHYCQNSTCDHKNGIVPLCVSSLSVTKPGPMTDTNWHESTDSKVKIVGTGHAREGNFNYVEMSEFKKPEAIVVNAGMEEEDQDYICSILASEVYQDVLCEEERCDRLKRYPGNIPQHLIPYFRKTAKNDPPETYEEFKRTNYVSGHSLRDASKKVRKSLSAVSVASHSKSIASAYKAFKEKKNDFSWSFSKNTNTTKSSDKSDPKQGKITRKSEEDLINRTARTVARMSKKSDLIDDKHKSDASCKNRYSGKPLGGNNFKPGSDPTCKPIRVTGKSGDSLIERATNAGSRSLRQNCALQQRVLGLPQTDSPMQHGTLPVRQSDLPLQQKDLLLRQSNSPFRQGALHVRQFQSHIQHGSLPLRQSSSPSQQGSLTFSQLDPQVLPFGQLDSSLLQTNSSLKPTVYFFQPSTPNVQQPASPLQSALSLKQPVASSRQPAAPSRQPAAVRFEPPHSHSSVSTAPQSASPFKRTAFSFPQKPSALKLVTPPLRQSQHLQQASSRLHSASSAKMLKQSFGLKCERSVLHDEAEVNRKLVARSSAASLHSNLIHLEPELQQPSYFKVTCLQNKTTSERKSLAKPPLELSCVMTQADQPFSIGQGDQQQWPEALAGWPESIQQFLASEQHLPDRYSGVNSSVLSSRSPSGISTSRTSINLNHEPFRSQERRNTGPEQLHSGLNSTNTLHSWESHIENEFSPDTVSSHLLNSTAEKFQQQPSNIKQMASCHPVPDIETAMFFHCGRIRPAVKQQRGFNAVTKSLSENWKSYKINDNGIHGWLDRSDEINEQSLILSGDMKQQSSGSVQSTSHTFTNTSAREGVSALSLDVSDSKLNCFDERRGHVSSLSGDLKESENLSRPNSIASASNSLFDDSLECEYYYDANDYFASDDDDEVEDLKITRKCPYEPSVQSSEGFIPRRVEDNFSQLRDDCLKYRHFIFSDEYLTTRASDVYKNEQRNAEKELFNVDRGLESEENSLSQSSFGHEFNPQFVSAKLDCDWHFSAQNELVDKLHFEEEISYCSDRENAVTDLAKTLKDVCNMTLENNSHGNLSESVQRSHFDKEDMNCSPHSLPQHSAYLNSDNEVIGTLERDWDYFESAAAQNQHQGNLLYNYGHGLVEQHRAAAETLPERFLGYKDEMRSEHALNVDKHSEQPVKRVRFLAAGNTIDNAHPGNICLEPHPFMERAKDGFNSDSKHAKLTEADHLKGAIISKSSKKLLSSHGQSTKISAGCRPMSAVLFGKSASLLRRGTCAVESQSDRTVHANREKAESKPLEVEQTASLPCCTSCAFCAAEKLGINIDTFLNEKNGSEKADSFVSGSLSNKNHPAGVKKHSQLSSNSVVTICSDKSRHQSPMRLKLQQPCYQHPLKAFSDKRVMHTLSDLNQTSTVHCLDLHLDLHSLMTETSDRNETPQQSSSLDALLSSENSLPVKNPSIITGADQSDGSLQSCESEISYFIKPKERFLRKTVDEASLISENRSESATAAVERLDLTCLENDVASPVLCSQSKVSLTVNAIVGIGNKSKEDNFISEHKNVSQSNEMLSSDAQNKGISHTSAGYRDTKFGNDIILSRSSDKEKQLVPKFKNDYDLYSRKASTPELKGLRTKHGEVVTETETKQALHSLEIPGTKTLMTKMWVKEKGWPTSCARHLGEPLKISSGNPVISQHAPSSLHRSSSVHISCTMNKVASTRISVKPLARSKSADPSRKLLHLQYKGVQNVPGQQQTNKFSCIAPVKPCLSAVSPLSDTALKSEKKVNMLQPQVFSPVSRHPTNKPQVHKSMQDVGLARSFSAPLSSVRQALISRSKGQMHETGLVEALYETKSVVAKFKPTKQDGESARIKVKRHNHDVEFKKVQVKSLNRDPESANIQVKSSYQDTGSTKVKVKSANKNIESTKLDMAKADQQKGISQASIDTKFSSTCTKICEANSAYLMKPKNNRKELSNSSQSLSLNTDISPSSVSTNIPCQSSDLSHKDEMAMQSKVNSVEFKTGENPVEILNAKSAVSLKSDNKIMPSSFKVHAKNIVSQVSIMTHGVSTSTSEIKPSATVDDPPIEKSEQMCLYTPREPRHPREQKLEPKISKKEKTSEQLQLLIQPKGTHASKKLNTIKKRQLKKKRHKDDGHCGVNGLTENGTENVSADLATKLNKTIAELDQTLEELDQNMLVSSGDMSIQITTSSTSEPGSAGAEINTSIRKIQSFSWNSGTSARSVSLNQDASSTCRSINISQVNQIASSDMEANSLHMQGSIKIKKKMRKRHRKRKHSKKITKTKKRKKPGKVLKGSDGNLPASLCDTTVAQVNSSNDSLKHKRSRLQLKKKTFAANVVNKISAFKLDQVGKANKSTAPAYNSGAGDFAHRLSLSKTPIIYGASAFHQKCIVRSCLNKNITACFAQGENNQDSENGSTQRAYAPNNSNRSARPSPDITSNTERSATPHYVSQAPSECNQLLQHQIKTPSPKLDPAQKLMIEADKYFDKFINGNSSHQQADIVSEDSQSVCGDAADNHEEDLNVHAKPRPGCSSWDQNSCEPCTCLYPRECCGSRLLVSTKGQIEKGLPSTKARVAGLTSTRFEGVAQLNRLSPPTLLYPRSPVISPRSSAASCPARSPVLVRPHSPTLDPALQLLEDVDQYFQHLTEQRQKWEEASQRLQNMLGVESSAECSVGQRPHSGSNLSTSCTNSCVKGKALAGGRSLSLADKDSHSQGEINNPANGLSDFDRNESHMSRSQSSFSDLDDANEVLRSGSRITDHVKSNTDRSNTTFSDHCKNGYFCRQTAKEEKSAYFPANGKILSKSAAYLASTTTQNHRVMQWTGMPRYSDYSENKSTCSLSAADTETEGDRGDKRGSEAWLSGGQITPQIDWLDTFGCGSQRSIVETYKSACKMHTISAATVVQGKERARPSSAPVQRWKVVDPSPPFLRVRGTHICNNANIIFKKVSESDFLSQNKSQMQRIAMKF